MKRTIFFLTGFKLNISLMSLQNAKFTKMDKYDERKFYFSDSPSQLESKSLAAMQ
jgi:hypothetical protein